ncbi:hypothetical protein Hanom_Chr04g00324701 [Helianthus anomalus]
MPHIVFYFLTLEKPVAKLEISDLGVEDVYTKKFYKTGGGGSKTYIPKNFYTKTTYSPLLSGKFRGSAVLSRPHKATPLRKAN